MSGFHEARLRFAYAADARFPGRRREAHVLRESFEARFPVHDREAPLLAVVTRDHVGTARIRVRPPGPQALEFRDFDGVLMRPVTDPNGVPLAADDLPVLDGHVALSRGKPWLDYPSPPAWGPQGLVSAANVLQDRADCGLRDLVADGRADALAAASAWAARCRVLDGVLWRPTVPPRWAIATGPSGSLSAFPCVPDLDSPMSGTRRSPALPNPACAPGAASPGEVLEAFLARNGTPAYCDVGVEVRGTIGMPEGPLPDPTLALDNAWSLREGLAYALGQYRWNEIDPGRRLTYAKLHADLDIALATGLDEGLAASVAASCEAMAADPCYRERFETPVSRISDLGRTWLAATAATDLVPDPCADDEDALRMGR